LTLATGTNLAGEPRDDLRADLSGVRGTPVLPDVAEEFLLRGALARALQMTGAMDAILDLCLDHVRTRTQFGRPLARFQAVQTLVADLAAEAALARAAATACTRGTPGPFDIAVARSCTGHAATVAVRNAHQIHGAIGTTAEHTLHTLTLPLLAWRTEYGTLHDWDNHLTTTATTTPLWPTLTGG
uniref:acyl-CoA dehydrogenase family protein n=1 Tax=Streptomyces phytophilus TaxID=722715 RepID=UPI0015F11246